MRLRRQRLAVLLVLLGATLAKAQHKIPVSANLEWSGILTDRSTELNAQEFKELDNAIREQVGSDSRLQIVPLGSRARHFQITVVAAKVPSESGAAWLSASVLVEVGKGFRMGVIRQLVAAAPDAKALATQISQQSALVITLPTKR